MSQSPRITVIGSVNLDFIIQTETLPRAGETLGHGVFDALPGGKGANVALMAQRLGAATTLLACVGDDVYADTALASLKQGNVDLSQIHHLSGHATGIAFINVARSGENQIAVASGANMAFDTSHLPHIQTDAIITQFEIPEAVILAAISTSDAFVTLNASPTGPDLAPLLPFIDLLIVNEGEYDVYKPSLIAFAGLIAVTLGAQGAHLMKDGQVRARAQPPHVSVVDTTGAGDSFAAALTIALMEKQSYDKALQFACTVGALTTTKLGTQSAAPYRQTVDEFMLKSTAESA